MRQYLGAIVLLFTLLLATAVPGRTEVVADPDRWIEEAMQEIAQGKTDEFARKYLALVDKPDNFDSFAGSLRILSRIGSPAFIEKASDVTFGPALREVIYVALYRQIDYKYFKFTIKKNFGGWLISNFAFKSETASLFPKDFVTAFAIPAPARPEPARQTVVGEVTAEQIASMLTETGYRAETVEGRRPLVRTAFGPYTVMIPLYDCKEDLCTSFQFHLSVEKPEKVTADWISAWNADGRYIKAYLDKSNKLVFEYDVTLFGGVTHEFIRSKAALFNHFIAEYYKRLYTDDTSSSISDSAVNFYGVNIPAVVAGAQRGKTYDYGVALGRGVEYRLADRQLSTVYFYDKEIPNIPDDLQAPIVKSEFEKGKEEIRKVKRYSTVDFKRDFTIDDGQNRGRFICSELEVVDRRDMVTRDSLICLGIVKNKFFKLRITSDQHDKSRAEALDFIGEWVKLLWPNN